MNHRAHRKLNESYKALLKSIQDATRANIRESQLLSITNRDEHSQYQEIVREPDDDIGPGTRGNVSPIHQHADRDSRGNSQSILFSQRDSNPNDNDGSCNRRSLFDVQSDTKNMAIRKSGRRDHRGHRGDKSRRGEHSESHDRRDRYI